MKTEKLITLYRFALTAVVAVAAFSGVLTSTAHAQNTVPYHTSAGYHYHPANNYGGEFHQGNNNGGGRLDQYGQNHRAWMDNKVTGLPFAHPADQYMYHHYRNTAHKKYYYYMGNEYYLNIDTGIRIQL